MAEARTTVGVARTQGSVSPTRSGRRRTGAWSGARGSDGGDRWHWRVRGDALDGVAFRCGSSTQAYRQVDVHDRAYVALVEQVIGSESVLNTRGGQRAGAESLILESSKIPSQSKPSREQFGRAQGRNALAAQQTRDRRMVDARFLRKLALGQLPRPELTLQPSVEREGGLPRPDERRLASGLPLDQP